jgi:hypothetical protein
LPFKRFRWNYILTLELTGRMNPLATTLALISLLPLVIGTVA